MNSHLRRLFSACVTVGLVATVVIGQSAAASNPTTFQFSFVATATTSSGPSIVAGDKFFVDTVLQLDTASTDSDPSYANNFDNSVVSFTLTSFPSNTGTWSSQGVVWNISPVFNLTTNANGDQLILQVKTSAAPDINSVPFNDIVVSLDWNQWDLDMVWQAGSTTLANKLGTRTPDLTAAAVYFEFRDTSLNSETFTISQKTLGPTTTTTTTSTTSTTVAPAPTAPSNVRYSPSNRKATISWSASAGGASYVVRNASGQQVCVTTSVTCVVSGITNGKSYTYAVYSINSSGLVSSSGTAISVIPGFSIKTTTVKSKKSFALSSLIASPSKGKQTWKVSSGLCRISKNRLITPTKSGTCRVTLSIAKWGSYASMATSVRVTVVQ